MEFYHYGGEQTNEEVVNWDIHKTAIMDLDTSPKRAAMDSCGNKSDVNLSEAVEQGLRLEMGKDIMREH